MRERLQILLEPLGAAGVLAIGVILYCAGFYLLGSLEAERELAALRRQAAAPPPRGAALQRVGDNLRTRQLDRFYRLFPPPPELTSQLEQLHRFAIIAGLQVLQGDYRAERSERGIGALHVSLPVRGDYAHVREFANLVLKELPTASIDTLRFERRSAGEALLEAQVQLTLYYRPEDQP